jgi:hypothetical protein
MRRLSLVLWLSICGCGTAVPAPPDVLGSGVSGKADGVDDGSQVTFTLFPAGAFQRTSEAVPDLVHYGLMANPGPNWQDAADAPITYGADDQSAAVEVTVSGVSTRPVLGFVLHEKSRTDENVWTENQYVDLGHPAGTLVTLPLSDVAPYPFQCYAVSVKNEGTPSTSYQGKVTDLYYGFTKADPTAYQANNDVAWLDAFDNPVAAGQITPMIRHNGDYKGAMELLPVYIRVPNGRNLVFKLGIDRFSGGCSFTGTEGPIVHAETQTYFVPAP